MVHSKQLLLNFRPVSRLVRSISCCVAVDHAVHKDGEGMTLLPALGVRRVTEQEQSWLRDQGQAVAAQV